MRQETGDMRRETGEMRQETGDRRCDTGEVTKKSNPKILNYFKILTPLSLTLKFQRHCIYLHKIETMWTNIWHMIKRPRGGG